ncbi:MAG: family 16 glycoside hydrolase [Planctomycetota bacterium]
MRSRRSGLRPRSSRPRCVQVGAALLLAAAAPAQQASVAEPVPVLLVTGANNHDWQWTHGQMREALVESGRFTVAVTADPATDLARDLSGFAAFVLDYNGPRWGDDAEAAFLAAVRAGAGVVVVHAADNAFPGWREYEELVGLCWRDGTGHGAYHPFDVHVVDPTHPVTVGMQDLRQHPDELYHRLVHTPGVELRVLLSAFSDPARGGTGRFEPMATAGRFGKGRVFHTPLGHTWTGHAPTRATWHDPQLRWLLARGTEWAATGHVTLPPLPPNVLADAERAEGFELLFDGRDLDGWRGYRQDGPPAAGWSVAGGAIVHAGGGGGGDLITVEEFGDFDFRFEWRVAAKANSGVIWHVLESEPQTYMTGPEYQVLDDLGVAPDARHGAGALYDLVANTGAPLRPAGSWNQGRIVVHDGRVQHWLNGQKLVDVPCRGPEWERMVGASKFRDWPFGKAGRGHLALQDHGDEVAYRSLRIRRL